MLTCHCTEVDDCLMTKGHACTCCNSTQDQLFSRQRVGMKNKDIGGNGNSLLV